MEDLATKLLQQRSARRATVQRRWSSFHETTPAAETDWPWTPFEGESAGADDVVVTPSGILTSRSLLEARSSLALGDRIAGSFVGSAVGDALGAGTEFISVEHILERWPPVGPTEITANYCQITDDTQMAISVARALLSLSPGEPELTALTEALVREFVLWLRSPDNDRAPGNTCISAAVALEEGTSWLDATVASSKGCGANMRVHPVAYRWWREEDDRIRSRVSQFQAALTHGHPTALAASDATSYVVALLLRGVPAHEVLDAVLSYCEAPPVYDEAWLGDLWRRAGASSPAEFVAIGSETRDALERIIPALASDDGFSDPCIACGDAWIAEEALSSSLYCFLAHCWDQRGARDALRRAAVSRGDSDSIACLAGAFAGACDGSQAWPRGWRQHLERHDELETLATKLATS